MNQEGEQKRTSWRSFVALGDSLTEGVGDPVPGGGLRGWADRLADGLRLLRPDLEYANLGRRGLVTRDIRDGQLARALELRPDLASVITGMNDAIRLRLDSAAVEDPLEEMVAALTGSGATVLMGTLPDVTRNFPLGTRFGGRLRAHLESINEIVRAIAVRHPGTVLADVKDYPRDALVGAVSIDRLHPNSRGHLLIARAFAEQLGKVAGTPIALPEPATVRLWHRESARHARWVLRESVLPDLRRRAGRLRRDPSGDT